MTGYKSYRNVDGKARWIIVDETGNIVNRNPSKDELKGLEEEPYTGKYEDRRCGSLKYTDEELINELRRFKTEKGRIPTQNDFINNPGYPSPTPYISHFGSWNKALILTGLGIRDKDKSYTDKQLLWYLLQFYEKYGIVPVERDFLNNSEYPSFKTYCNRFGSWSNALKLVELDVESIIKEGILVTNQQKARYAEIKVIEHFKQHPIDLAGKNCLSPCDGICPNDRTYDVKSSKLYIGEYYSFSTKNKYKEDIEIYYFLAFNEDYSKLMYVWRVPGEIAEGIAFYVGLSNRSHRKFTVENMKEYDITDKFRDIVKI